MIRWRIVLGVLGVLSLAIAGGGIAMWTIDRQSCDRPASGWRTPQEGMPELAPDVVVSIEPQGSIRWNGTNVTRQQFARYLIQIPDVEPTPFVILTVDPQADCDIVRSIRAEMERTLECSKGYCGEGDNWHR